MSASDVGEFCAAYGCPMIAAIGVGARWYCACHWRGPIASFDAITAELHRQKALVDAAVLARRSYAGYAAIRAAEDVLVALTHAVGQQYGLMPTRGATGGVIGPTHANEHWSNEGSETEA